MLIQRHLLPRKWANYTHCMNVTYPLSIATPNALLNRPVRKVPRNRDGDMYRSNNTNIPAPRLTRLQYY